MSGSDARGTLGTVRNAVLLLDLLSEGPAYQHLTDLAERSGLSVPTVHRLLRSLVLAGLAEQDPVSARYGLGPEVARLSQRYLARLPILAALSPYLVPLRDAVQATVHVAILVRGTVVYVDRVDGADAGLYRVPHRAHPALETASGRLLLAHADDAVWKRALDAAPEDQRALAEAERETWRTAPYLISRGEPPALLDEIAVGVPGPGGRAVAALGATLPPNAPDQVAESVAAHLTRTALAAGRTLGHA